MPYEPRERLLFAKPPAGLPVAFVSATGKVFASLPQVERGVSKIIGGDPKGANFLYTNGKCVIIRNIDVICETYNADDCVIYLVRVLLSEMELK
uniref:Uncharacterized protein n=1 Tax=Sphaerodactylus townsendi TaxID=933632 RepID=A0ACB8E6E3_9SAUR